MPEVTENCRARLRSLQSWLVVIYAAVLPISLTGSWAVLIAGLVVAFLQLICTTGGERLPARLVRLIISPPLSPQLLVFTLIVGISGTVAGGPVEGLASIFTLRALLVYFWSCHALAMPQQQARAAAVLLSVSAVAGLWGTIQQLTGFHPFSYHYLQGTGFLGGPMAFAGQMQIFSLLSLGLYLSQGYRALGPWLSKRPVFLGIVLCNGLGVVFASERSAWLGFLSAVPIVFAIWSWRSLLKVGSGLVLALTLSWFTIPVVSKRLLPLLNWQNDVSVQVRFFLWQQAALLFKSSPIFGIGIRRFPHFDIPEAIVPGHSVDINHAHSNYIQMIATTGLVGLVAYLWLWLAALRCSLENYRSAGEPLQRGLSLGILGGIIALMVSGVFEYNFGTAQVRLAQWFVLGMLACRPKPAGVGSASVSPAGVSETAL